MSISYDKVVPTLNKHKWVNSCEYIVIHHTWGWSYEWNVNVLSKWKSVSCHYVVWSEWRIAKIWNDTDILRHCWTSEREWRKDMNRYCIWIEVVNIWYTFTDKQRESVRNLIISLKKKHNIPENRILRHKDIAPKRKVDIYDSFRNNKYKTFIEYQLSFKDKDIVEQLPPIVKQSIFSKFKEKLQNRLRKR